MYKLHIFENDYGDSETYFYNSLENAKTAAREIAKNVVDGEKTWYSPKDYGCDTWEEYIDTVVEDCEMLDIFYIAKVETMD